MVHRCLLILVCACTASPGPSAPPEAVPAPPATPLPPHSIQPNLAAAVQSVLLDQHRIIGVGELHQTEGGPQVVSTAQRFTDQVLPSLAPHTSDLVIETWVLDGQCGPQEVTVTAQITEETARPAVVEDQIARMARVAGELGVRPHALSLSCDDYASVQDAAGEVVYGQLLTVLTQKLQGFAEQAQGREDVRMLLYGGAVHNDVHPRESLAAYSYGPAVVAQSGPAYVELDLFVPELAAGIEGYAEEPWFALLEAAKPDQVLVHARAPNSYVLILTTTPGAVP